MGRSYDEEYARKYDTSMNPMIVVLLFAIVAMLVLVSVVIAFPPPVDPTIDNSTVKIIETVSVPEEPLHLP